MKRKVVIYSAMLIVVSLLFFGFSIWNTTPIEEVKSLTSLNLAFEQNEQSKIPKETPDLYYGVDTRFAAITKSDIAKATTIYDFLNTGEKEQIVEINSVKIVMIKNNELSSYSEYGSNEQLTDAQLKLIRSTEYFHHFTVRTEFKGKNKETGKLEDKFFGPHLTVVPDKQATYVDGKDALLNYLKDKSSGSMSVIEGDKLGAIKISFIVTKNGKISNVEHDAMSTGYSSLDEKLMELIKNIPGQWISAENALGEKMDYEFVFTFGPRDGC